MEVLRQAKENTSNAGSDTEEPRDLESEEKSSTEEPRDSGTTADEPTDSRTKEPRSRANRSNRRSQRRGQRQSSQTGRRSKAFQFSPAEERAFKRLVIEVEELVHEEDSAVSVQNSHLVRAMVQMVADDIREGYTDIVGYVLDEIDKD